MTTSRRPDFRFDMVGIPLGATLTLDRDNSVTCFVVKLSPAQVFYDGEVRSLSDSAGEAAGLKWMPNGTHEWCYEGQTLWDRRMRFERYHRSEG